MLGILVISTLRPRFEGFQDIPTIDVVYKEDDFDNPAEESTATVPRGQLDTGITSGNDQKAILEGMTTEDMTLVPQPSGIPQDQIPPGEEDLYILKSQVVPPVCPACPSACPVGKKSADECPACPPCARCPEPAYDCKLVPNYESAANTPIPMLNDFSAF